MTLTLDLALYVLAFLCFLAAAFRVSSPMVDFFPLGWACLVLTLIL